MSDKWTKGPWTVGMEDGVTCHAAERNPGWFVVSAPYPPFAFGQGIAVFASEADATVAAAAPDMAEALEALVNAEALSNVESIVAGWNGPPEKPYAPHPANLGASIKTTCGRVYKLDEAMKNARAALAKARGGQT